MQTWFSDALQELSTNPLLQGGLAALATFVLEDPALVICAFLVADEQMLYMTALLGLTAGIGIGDWGLYALGRMVGKRTVRWGLVSQRRIDRMGKWFERNLVAAIFVSRFIPGLRLPANVAAGISHMPPLRYLPIALLASFIWTFVALSAIAKVGEVILPILGQFKWYAVGALALWILIIQHRSYRSLRDEADDGAGDSRPASPFEFWHPAVFYAPVGAYYMFLAMRYRSLTLPTAANPAIYCGGMIGESKCDILDLVPSETQQWIAPYVRVHLPDDDSSLDDLMAAVLDCMREAGLEYPVVAKPDKGQRGAGVRPVWNDHDLKAYLAPFPRGAAVCIQELVPFRNEVGVMYFRRPEAAVGQVMSVTRKEFLTVTGDGERTLRELITVHPRAHFMRQLFFKRHEAHLDRVLGAGEEFPLVFTGNHAQGCVFRDGRELVTEPFRRRIDEIARAIPEFYFGRFDIRYDSLETLQRGEGFKIVEINGAGAEATHIWDPDATLSAAYRTLFEQFRILFEIGDANRIRGHIPVGPRQLIRDALAYWRLALKYPMAQ